MRAKKINEAIKHMPGMEIIPPPPKYNYKKFRKYFLDLRKLGYIVKEEESTSNYGRNIYWKIGSPEGTGFTGVGYKFPNVRKKTVGSFGRIEYEEQGDYFFHNSHSGNINKPSTAPNSVWNFSKMPNGGPGPEGWYTFDDKYVLDVIESLKNKAPKIDEAIKHLPGRPKEDFYFLTNIRPDPEEKDTYLFNIDYEKLIPYIKELIPSISENEMNRFLAFEIDEIIEKISDFRFEKNDLDWINGQLKSGIQSVAPHWMGMHSDKAMRTIMRNSGMNI